MQITKQLRAEYKLLNKKIITSQRFLNCVPKNKQNCLNAELTRSVIKSTKNCKKLLNNLSQKDFKRLNELIYKYNLSKDEFDRAIRITAYQTEYAKRQNLFFVLDNNLKSIYKEGIIYNDLKSIGKHLLNFSKIIFNRIKTKGKLNPSF